MEVGECDGRSVLDEPKQKGEEETTKCGGGGRLRALDQLFGVRRKISEGILRQMGTKIGRVFGGLD